MRLAGGHGRAVQGFAFHVKSFPLSSSGIAEEMGKDMAAHFRQIFLLTVATRSQQTFPVKD